MTTQAPADTAAVLAEIEAQLTALGEPSDVVQTYNAQAEYAARSSSLRNRMTVIRNSQATLDEVEPQIAELTKWRDHLVEWQTACEDQLRQLDSKDPKRYGYELSLRRIESGLDFMHQALPARLPLDDLMADSGYVPADAVARANGDAWFGSLPDVERRLRDLTARRDDAERRLRFVLTDPV